MIHLAARTLRSFKVLPLCLGALWLCLGTVDQSLAAEPPPSVATPTTDPITPTPEVPTPLPTSTPPSPWGKDLLGLEYDLATTGYALNPSDASRIKLISISERLVSAHCLEGVSPAFKGRVKDPTSPCGGLITRLLELDKNSPFGICANEGFESESCSSAFEAIEIGVLDPKREGLDKDLDAILATKQSTEDFIAIENDLIFTGRSHRSDPSPENLSKLETLYRKHLEGFCTVSRLRIPTPAPIPATPTPDPSVRPFDRMISELSRHLDNPNKPRKELVNRIRLVSAPCHRILSLLNEYAPQSYLNKCYRLGVQSPQCHRARRRAGVTPNDAPLSEGMSKF